MTSLEEQLSGGEYNSWITATLALDEFRKGIVDAIDEIVKEQHKEMLKVINGKHGCSECYLDTLLPEHKRSKSHKCPLRHPECNCLYRNGKRSCPNMFCSSMYDMIIKYHTSCTPIWRNTDIKEWYGNYWEIANCYMNIPKDSTRRSVKDVDISGLLSIGISNSYVASKFECSEDFDKIRLERNDVFHCAGMQFDEKKLQSLIDRLISVLDKNSYLRNRHEAKLAIDNLNQLLDGKLDIKLQEKNVVQKAIDTFKLECKDNPAEGQSIDHAMNFKNIFTRLDQLEAAQNDHGQHKTGNNVEVQTQHEMPSLSRPHDGRLIALQDNQLYGLMSNCEEKVIKGGFGDVYITKDKVQGLDVKVIIKKIVSEGEDAIELSSACNEKIAARIMHFAIVPLIAYMDKDIEGYKREFYFISPYLERGSLFEFVSKDKRCTHSEDICLKRYRRIHILFQIASALDYIHTPVPGSRGIILHMDLTTTNIVLDSKFNARLTDFGLAREMNEGQSKASLTQSKLFGTPGYRQTARNRALTVHNDYYNFGVVIRELLTGEEPYQKSTSEYIELRRQSKDFIIKTLQDNIWKDSKKDGKEALKLNDLSAKCLEEEKEITSNYLVKEIKKMYSSMFPRAKEDKCDLCMVNVAVKPEQSPSHRCRMKICVSCMRNSHVNPIKCHSCNGDVIPEIGHTYAAVLIAGNDTENDKFAMSFSKEVNEIKVVLTSKFPCVIGIRKENMKTVIPSNPGQEESLLPQVRLAFDSLKSKKDVKTLLVYFTGHYDKERGFMLGSKTDILTLKIIQKLLKGISEKWGNTPRFLIFLDCCNAPSLGSIPDLSNEYVKIAQVNACASYQQSRQPLSGSHFQKYFIQALTRRAFNEDCHSDIQIKSEDTRKCLDCEMIGDFISIEQLLKYITVHMKRCYSGVKPVQYTNGITWLDASIGYNIDFVVDLNLKLELGSGTAKKVYPVKLKQKIYHDIQKLKECILETFRNTHEISEELELTPVEFADSLALRIHTGSEGGTELDSVLKVSAAFDSKLEVLASYRTVSNIQSGRVVSFMPTKYISEYIDKKKPIKNVTKGERVANFSLNEINDVTDEIKTDKKTLDRSQKEKDELEKLYKTLLIVYDKWKHGKEQDTRALRVIFPCVKGDIRRDFFVLDLYQNKKSYRKHLIILISVLVLAVALLYNIWS